MTPTRVGDLAHGSAIEVARAAGTRVERIDLAGDRSPLEFVRGIEVDYLPQALDTGQGLQVLPGGTVPIEAVNYDFTAGFAATQLSARGFEQLPATAPGPDVEVCILGNLFARNFTHWHEELLKVVALERAGIGCSYVLSELPAFARDSLALLGIDEGRILQLREPTRFARAVYSTSVSYVNASEHPSVLLELRSRLLAGVTDVQPRHGERIWLDRGAQTRLGRSLVNREQVHAALDRCGFRLLDMGSLSLREQYAAARDMRVMAGIHGSAFVHSQMMAPRSHVIEAFSPLYLNPTYTEIYRVLRHRYSQLGITNTPIFPYPHGGDVEVDMQQLELALDSLDD